MSIPNSPELIKSIPDWTFYAKVNINPLNLNDYIQNRHPADGEIQFSATLADGSPLPAGIFCEPDGDFHGQAGFEAVSSEPYSILVVAKNSADVPLVAYFDLTISYVDDAVIEARGTKIKTAEFDLGEPDFPELAQADEVDLQTQSYEDTDEEFENFLASLDADYLKTDPDALAEAVADGAQGLSRFLDDPDYIALFVRHMLRKFSSLQIYNAGETFSELSVLDRFNAKTGWTVYDSKFALTTTNPNAFATDFSRSEFIATVREMIAAGAERGWRTVGVKGCDRELGFRLVTEYNEQQEVPSDMLQLDDFYEATSWLDRAMRDVRLTARGH